MTIAYILQSYPSLTMTFIYREVLALERIGFNVVTFSTWKPNRDKLSPESRHLMDSTFYIFPAPRLKFLLAHLYFLFTRPVKYIGTALFVLTRKGESWQNRRRTVYHFGEAIYVAKEIQRQKIKHVHAHFATNATTITLIVARLLDISFSFTAHNIFFTDRVILKEKMKEALFVVSISEFSRQFLIDLFPGEDIEGKIHIVHCGVSPDQFSPLIPESVNAVPLIFFVAQLAERKGAPILVEACKILVERGVVFQCIIAGDGPERMVLERLIERCDLGETIILTGAIFQKQLREYLAQSDIFALPCITASDGDMDGIPVVLMEAMAYEVATISTDVSGIPELIRDGESGLLVQEKDPVALADALQRLIQDEQLRDRLGKGGRRMVLHEFDIDQNAMRLATFFEKYLGSVD